MGKGTIISHAGDGLYNITLNLDTARALAEYAKLATVIPAIEAAIEDIEDEIETLRNELSLIDPFKHVDDYVSKLNELQHKNKEKNRTTLLLASAKKRYQMLDNNIPEDPAVEAWCADKTTSLSGEVGTIEVPGERKTNVNIQPGYGGNAAYSSTRDGKLQPSISGLANNIFVNWAMLAGWQKWMPTYRYGTITSIDTEADTCNVTLEAATSSVKDDNGVALNVNAVDALENVPIVYMDVNSEAFAVDDVVLIKFDSVKADIRDAGNWANCTVIGFKDHPKYPEGGALLYLEAYNSSTNDLDGYIGLDQNLELMDTLETSISYPQPLSGYDVEDDKSSNIVINSWGTPTVSGPFDQSNQWAWYFKVINNETETITTSVIIDENSVKERTCIKTNPNVSRTIIIFTAYHAPQPPTPPNDDFLLASRVSNPFDEICSGSEVYLKPFYNHYVDSSHYMYIWDEYDYYGTAYDQYMLRTYLNINGTDTLLCESDDKAGDGYYVATEGYTAIGYGVYGYHPSIYYENGTYYYICCLLYYSYSGAGLTPQYYCEYLHSDGTTLKRKTYESTSNRKHLFGTIGGTAYYGDGTIVLNV